MSSIENRIAELGFTLPEPAAPLAAYVPYVRSGNLIFVSGQLPAGPAGLVTGQLSADHHVDGDVPEGSEIARAQQAAQLCCLNLLAHVKSCVGDLDKVTRVVKLTGFVNCDGTFNQHPVVVNGASQLMSDVFGEKGQHARAAVGSSSLPLGVMVEVEGIFEVS